MHRLAVSVVTLAVVFLLAESRHIDLTKDANLEDVSTDMDLLENQVIVKTRPVNQAPIELLKTLVEKVNQAMILEKKEYLTIPPVSFNVLLAKVSTDDGTLGRFSSLYLQGDDQMLKKTVVKGATIYNFDLKLGMKDLHLRYPYGYRYLFFFGNDGVYEMTTKDDGVRITGVVNIKDDGTCKALLSNVQATKTGDYDVNVTPSNLSFFTLKAIAYFFTNKVLPYILPTVNTFIKEAALEPSDAAADFSKLFCDNVIPHVTKVF